MIEGIFIPQWSVNETSWAISGYCGGSNNSRGVYNRPGDKYQKPHVLVAKLFTIYKDLLRVLCY